MGTEKSSLPSNGYDLCECGWKIVDGICTNPSCPTQQVYDNGYRAKKQAETYPVIEIE